jgi:DNA-binding LacI/PurR family transcriptional regulator
MGYIFGVIENTSKDIGLTIYATLAARLRRSIHDGEYQPGQMIGSEHELARRQSISRVTVRRASELLINEGLLERRPGKGLFVREGYVANTPMPSPVIQVVAGNLQWEPSLQVSRGIQSLAREEGFQVQLYDAQSDVESDLAMLSELPAGPARGAIIMSLHSALFNEAIYALKIKGFPFVLVDQQLHDINVSSVAADNYSGGLQAGQALLELGHRRIAFIGDVIATTVRDRLMGLRDAIGDAGLPFDRSLIVDLSEEGDKLGGWAEKIGACTRDIMSIPNPPTALFFSCDGVARAGYRALAQMGLRIPEDVSVIGFDDDPIAEWLTPGLTTVRQPFFEMGVVAIQSLRERIADPLAPVRRNVLPVQLVKRGSIGQIR